MWRKLVSLSKSKTITDKQKFNTFSKVYQQDMHNQKRLSDVTYTGMDTHGTLREDLRSQAIVRRKWKSLLLVDDDTGMELNLLDDYMKLTLDDLQEAKRLRTGDEIAPARNLYLSVWNTLGSKPKTKMVGFLEDIGEDGPTLLWTLLTQYHGTAAQIIRSMRIKIDSFKDRLKLCHGDIDKFLDHVRKTMDMLKSAGGSDDQAFDKIYEALVETHVTSFNKTIRVWNTVMDQSGQSGTKTISALINKARTEYQSLLG